MSLKAVEAKQCRWTSVTHGSKAAELLLCHSRPLPLLPGERMWGKAALFYHNAYHIKLVFPCFYKTKTEIDGVMTSLAGDTMTRDEPLFKIYISLDLNILGNLWDNVSTQVSKVYNTVLVIFGYFNKIILHIVPLITFAFMHLADAFIQSDLHCIQVIVLHFISSCFPLESNPWSWRC